MMTSSPQSALFIADIHLPIMQPEHPLSQAFLSLLAKKAREFDRLYILGDLFDGWLGDDVGLVHYAPIISALADYTATGHELWIGHGNRDFLLKESFFEATHAHYLAEETEVQLGDECAILMHGDSLCTDDLSYQAFRQQALTPEWQAKVLALSLQERLALLAKIKDQSKADMHHKSDSIMDVTETALNDIWQRHPSCQYLIHGHTHKPAHHIDTHNRHRWVLGDWRPSAQSLSYHPTSQLTWFHL